MKKTILSANGLIPILSGLLSIFLFGKISFSQPLNYSQAANWLCHPMKSTASDPSNTNMSYTLLNTNNSIGATTAVPYNTSSNYDVFFIQGTNTSDGTIPVGYMGLPGDTGVRKQDTVLNYQTFIDRVGYFVQFGRVYAPNYRKASPATFSSANVGQQADLHQKAADDVIAAFQYYLANNNNGHKIILVGHSQGAGAVMMLLRKIADNDTTIRKKIFLTVVGGLGPTAFRMYVNNGTTNNGWLQNIPICQNPLDTACVMSWISWKDTTSPALPNIPTTALIRNDSLLARGYLFSKFNSSTQEVSEDKLGFSTSKAVTKSFFPKSVCPTCGITTTYIGYTNMYTGRIKDSTSMQFGFMIKNAQAGGDVRVSPLTSLESSPSFSQFGYHAYDYNIAAQDIIDLIQNKINSSGTTGNTTDPWTQIINNGFGSTNTISVNEMHVFKNQIYAGTQSTGGTGSFQIWKSSTGNTGSWTKVTSYTPALTPADASLISLSHTDFGGGIMYCGDVNIPQGGVVYRTTDGTSFTKISKRGMGSTNSAITPNMVVFKGTAVDTFLYAGIGNTSSSSGAASVWRLKYNSTDSTAWVKVIDFNSGLGIGTADTSIKLPTYFYVWNNKIYVGCLSSSNGSHLYRSDDGATWTAVNSNGFGSTANRAVASIVDYKNFLYATTTNSAAGGQLWRSSDGINFTQVTGNAFGKGNLIDELHNIRVANGWLWASGQWLSGTVQPTIVWRSSDGTTWVQSNTDGFGNTNNNGGGPIFIQFGSNVYCGMKDTVTGAQIWRTNVGVPVASFTSSDSIACTGVAVNFTNTSQVAITYEWQLNGVTFDTLANTSYTFNTTGTDTISLIAHNGNLSDTATLVIPVNVCSGIKAISPTGMMRVFPNPNNGKFYVIHENNDGLEEIIITNLLGQTVKTISRSQLSGSKIEIDLQEKGVYFLQGRTSTGVSPSIKLIVK